MSKPMKISRAEFVFIVIGVFISGLIFGGAFIANTTPVYPPVNITGERAVNILLPAVDSEGNGVVADLSTTVTPGTGKILLDASSVLNYPDTQLSARDAAEAAGNYAKLNLSSVDITYAIRANATVIEGPSAGAAMAISVLMALNNRTNGNVAITGTINPDGTIGQVGAVPDKARAAKANGITTFLVPVGQINAENNQRERTCETTPQGVEICKITYNAGVVNIGDMLNMTVHEVSNIGQAYQYFLDESTP